MSFNKNFPFMRGSEWRKWDLHVHTPFSLVQSFGGNTEEVWEQYIKDLESLPQEFTVLGINDYLFIDGYEKVLEYKAKGRLKNITTIFPVIEFRIKKFGGHKEFKRINFHVIFSDSLTPLIIRQQFLNQLYGNYKLSPEAQGVVWNGVVTPESLADLGGKIRLTVPAEELPNYGTDVEEGFNNINFDEDQLRGILNSSTYLKDHFVTAIGKTEWDSFNWGDSSIAEKKTVINLADFVFTSSEDVTAFNNAKKKLTDQGVNNFLLDCSDAHNFSNATIKDRIGKCFTWVKSDPTFEGLKLLKYEQDRVRVQERNPSDSKPDRITIDNITYKLSSGQEEKVVFNKDLNSIIGVRGSGKSTLLKNIAIKIDPLQFKERDKKKPYNLSEFNVTWSDAQENSGSVESPKSVFYIPQNYLSSLAYEDGDHMTERDEFLTKLLKKNLAFANAVQSFDTFASLNKIRIEEIIEKILTADESIKETDLLLKKQGSNTEIEKEINQKTADIKKYQVTLGPLVISDKEIGDYSRAQKDIITQRNNLSILNQDLRILLSLKETGANIFISNQQFGLLSITRQELIRLELNKKSKDELDVLIVTEISEIQRQIEIISKEIAEKEKMIAGLDEKINKSKALQDLTKEIAGLEATQERIKELIVVSAKSRENRVNAIEDLAAAYSDFDTQQEAIYKTVEFQENFSFLKVEIIAKYNTNQIKNFVERNINTRDSESSLKKEADIENLFSDNPEKPSSETIKKVIDALLDGRIKIKVEASDVGNVISQLLKNRFEIDYLNSVKTKNGETCFKDMTGGQKAIALLELIFRFDDEKYPILIDQPEDDLDVGGVATDLVNFIKTEKDDRQLIVVTHNASLVVCSDTEEIIVSNITLVDTGGYDFTYATGSIENQDRRKDIIRVLEGGEESLQKRMRKLNIN
jgi:energy-coupling factor transporter ATP-binding protein EcfA2